jgi:hypothetical protein
LAIVLRHTSSICSPVLPGFNRIQRGIETLHDASREIAISLRRLAEKKWYG